MKKNAFTLIELLIVVAIIAILAAIAVPNFLEAQVRSKVSRCKADQRSVATALEAYRVDNNKYPMGYWSSRSVLSVASHGVRRLSPLTTPVAYITSIPEDPFMNTGYYHSSTTYLPAGAVQTETFAYESTSPMLKSGVTYSSMFFTAYAHDVKYWMRSVGPSRIVGGSDSRYFGGEAAVTQFPVMQPYDATNGTTSVGEIYRTNFGTMEPMMPVYPRVNPVPDQW